MVDYTEPANEVFAYEDIVIHGEVYGRVLRTHQNVCPIFLSVGNLIDLETAMEVTEHFVTKESHIPMPTRCADIMTHEMRKEYQSHGRYVGEEISYVSEKCKEMIEKFKRNNTKEDV